MTTVNELRVLPASRYLKALERIRESIAQGKKLDFYDDTTPGNKSSSCTWGLCSEDAEHWPDAEDHTFPTDFTRFGRMSPISRGEGDMCPLDRRQGQKDSTWGCFYHCRVFRSKKDGIPSLGTALKLYDEAIERAKERLS